MAKKIIFRRIRGRIVPVILPDKIQKEIFEVARSKRIKKRNIEALKKLPKTEDAFRQKRNSLMIIKAAEEEVIKQGKKVDLQIKKILKKMRGKK